MSHVNCLTMNFEDSQFHI